MPGFQSIKIKKDDHRFVQRQGMVVRLCQHEEDATAFKQSWHGTNTYITSSTYMKVLKSWRIQNA